MVEDSRAIHLLALGSSVGRRRFRASFANANFQAGVSLSSHVDPMAAIGPLGRLLAGPEGDLVHDVPPSGPRPVMSAAGTLNGQWRWDVFERAERSDTDIDRLETYEQLHRVIIWLSIPRGETKSPRAQ